MKRILSALLLAAGISCLFGAESLKIRKPENRAVLSPMTTLQHLVMTVSPEQQEALWADKIFMQRISACPKGSLPQGVEFQLEYQGTIAAPRFRIIIADNEKLENGRQIIYAGNTFQLYNLFPGMTFYWKGQVLDEEGKITAETKVNSFSTEALLPRVSYLPGATNARDLGGMTAAGGHKIPYGMFYRSSAINPVQATAGFGIRTELDLRWKSETAGQTQSVWGPEVKYINIPAKLYGAMFTSSGMANYAELFRVFTQEDDYPINFHCVVGADRTGTLAFLLEAVLGCNTVDIRRDYVFSSFASPRYFSAIDALLNGMDEFAAEATDPLQWKAERYLLKAGVSAEEIYDFQCFVLGDDLEPSPVLATWLEIGKMKGDYAQECDVQFLETSPMRGTMIQCGKEFSFNPGGWPRNPLVFSGADGKGAFLFQFNNDSREVCYGCFQGDTLTATAYTLLNPTDGIAYLAPNGTTSWTPQELAQCCFPLPAVSTTLLQIRPADTPVPEGYAIKDPVVQDMNVLMASSKEAAPIIDGKLDDAMWATQTPYPLCAVDGTPVSFGNAYLYLGTNPAHDVIYMAVKVEDDTYAAQERPHDRDCWADDEVEFFFSAVGDSTYYQLIFNRAGSTFDGKGQNVGWNMDSYDAKTAETDGGWVLEAAIPLAQFQLPNAIELNVCTTDVPKNTQRNLGATGGIYHTREALKPILLK